MDTEKKHLKYINHISYRARVDAEQNKTERARHKE